MTPELIEAAAKLCGWSKDRRFTVHIDAVTGERVLSDTGLLALEDALGDAGWRWDKAGSEGGTLCYRWRQPCLDSEGHQLSRRRMDPDRATAACLAAQAELEGK